MYLAVRFGFSDKPNLPQALAQACETGVLDHPRSGAGASTSCARARSGGPGQGMAQSRKMLFLRLAHNAANPAAYFGLPVDRTVTMGSPVDV